MLNITSSCDRNRSVESNGSTIAFGPKTITQYRSVHPPATAAVPDWLFFVRTTVGRSDVDRCRHVFFLSNSFAFRRCVNSESGGAPVQDTGRDGDTQVRFRVGRRHAVRGQVVQGKRGVLPVRAQVESSKDVLPRGRHQNRRELKRNVKINDNRNKSVYTVFVLRQSQLPLVRINDKPVL